MHSYLAGRMTGIKAFNFPAFDDAARKLRASGRDITSPAELDDPETRDAALASPDGAPGSGSHDGRSWASFVLRDLELIADGPVDSVICLPDWERSRGARWEVFTARLHDYPIFAYRDAPGTSDGFVLHEITGEVASILAEADPGATLRADGEVREPVLVYGGKLGDEAAVAQATGEVRVTDPRTGGQKGRKPQRYNLIPWDCMDEVAALYAAGAQKYEAHNWAKGYDWDASFDSLIRHATAFWRGESLDPELGTHHMASVVFHAFALMRFERTFPEGDTRYLPNG